MGNSKYSWYEFNMNVACTRCGSTIAMESPSGTPTCNECGETNRLSWDKICTIADLSYVRNDQTCNKKVIGEVEVNVNNPDVATISCNHCKQDIELSYDPLETNNCNCPLCKEKLVFEKTKSYSDLLFYRYVKQRPNHENNNNTIAVRCAACGGPLQTDPGKINYKCTFCGVENILPVSMRQKRILDDVFIGAPKRTITAKQILESKNPNEIISCLESSKPEDFSEGILDKVMQNFSANFEIYKLITNKLGYKLSEENIKDSWNRSPNEEFVTLLGKKLKKNDIQIRNQFMRFDRNYKAIPEPEEKKSLWDKIKWWFV